MWIAIDKDENGNIHAVNLGADGPLVEHPDGSKRMIPVKEMLVYLNDHEEARVAGGWHEARQRDGESEPTSKWTRLVNQVSHPDAPWELKAMGLRHVTATTST